MHNSQVIAKIANNNFPDVLKIHAHVPNKYKYKE